MQNKIGLLLILLLGISWGSVQALEIQRGRVKVTINERNGRFNLFMASDLSKPVFVPLWLSEDPTTSKVKVTVEDKSYVLGDDSEFGLAAEAVPTGARLVWTSKKLRIIQTFEFLTSPSSTVADGIRVTFTLNNPSDSVSLKAGLRFVLDTNLGEKKDHFLLPNGDKINNETRFDIQNLPEYVVSPSAMDDKVGLLVMLAKGSTPPSKVYFANWKRLDETSWDLSYHQGRDFNLLPYSYNDSAIALFWDPQTLAPGQSRDIAVLMGSWQAKTFLGAQIGTSNPLNDIMVSSRGKDGANLDQALAQDSQLLDDLLKQMDEKLKAPKNLTDDDLKMIQNALDQLEQRKKIFQPTVAPKE